MERARLLDTQFLDARFLDARFLAAAFAVTPQLRVEQVSVARAAGFGAIINNRPDGESPDQPSSAELAAAAAALGLAYHYIPVSPWDLTDEAVGALADILAATDKPILASCRSGTRCACLWALAEAPRLGAEAVLAAGAAAGYDLSVLELDARAPERLSA